MTLFGASVLLVVFGALTLVLDLVLLIATPRLLGRARHVPRRSQPDWIMAWRFAPVGLAALVTATVFVPAWWQHEPKNSGEVVSLALLAAACFSTLPVCHGVFRAFRMFFRTRDRLRAWRRHGESRLARSASFDVLEVRSRDLTFCVGGYLRPTIYASSQVLRDLEPEESAAALAHEVSHAKARDPLRLLAMGACPDFLCLFDLDRVWRRGFASACEFAADASARGGSPEVALDLASALLKVTRLDQARRFGPDPLNDLAVSSAYSGCADLEARVAALTEPESWPETGRLMPARWLVGASVLLTGALGLLFSPQVHEVTEWIGRSLAP